MRTTYNLPMEMTLPTGETLKPVIGGTLENKPFCEVRGLFGSQEQDTIKAEARRRGLKYRRIGVLSRNLRGKYDLHGNLYRANVWSFVEVCVCPNCGQWRNATGEGYKDCFHECVRLGFVKDQAFTDLRLARELQETIDKHIDIDTKL